MKSINLKKFENQDIADVIKEGEKLEKFGTEGKINAHKLYTACINNVPKDYSKGLAYIRGLLRFRIWDIEKFFGWNDKYYSQAGQDKFIYENFFKDQKNGFFIEIGAYDGITGSNCNFFEKYMNWDGIAIEPSPKQFEKLKINRKCKIVNMAIAEKSEKKIFLEASGSDSQMSGLEDFFSKEDMDFIKKRNILKKHLVEVTTLDDIIKKTNMNKKVIDYCSIDIEGAEISLLKNFNFSNYKIKVLSVENNWFKTTKYDSFLVKQGYSFYDSVGVDEIWFNNKLVIK